VRAGNSSPSNDEAAAVLLAAEGALAGEPLTRSTGRGRIVSHAAHELKRRGSGVAVVAVCIAVGQGLAIVLEG